MLDISGATWSSTSLTKNRVCKGFHDHCRLKYLINICRLEEYDLVQQSRPLDNEPTQHFLLLSRISHDDCFLNHICHHFQPLNRVCHAPGQLHLEGVLELTTKVNEPNPQRINLPILC